MSIFDKKNSTKNDAKHQIEAINKSQAVIEFTPDGTILTANSNFLGAMGYDLSEIQGQHHRQRQKLRPLLHVRLASTASRMRCAWPGGAPSKRCPQSSHGTLGRRTRRARSTNRCRTCAASWAMLPSCR